MKRMMMACALLMAVSGAVAQNCYMAPAGVSEKDGKVVIDNPTTTLAVDLTVEKEVVLCGPYARYAQKFFGVRAPLTDKTTFTLKGADVSLAAVSQTCFEVPAPGESVQTVSSHSRSDLEFARIQPDKVDMNVLPLEDAAREAANAVFSLRKHRMDLITGEAGENVFGAGLEAALNEIARLEQNYLELFLGKRVVTIGTSRMLVRPAEGKFQYIICRFTPEQGIVPESDLSGEIVLMQIDPSNDMQVPFEATRKDMNTVTYRIAASSDCVVTYGNQVLTKNVLPIFEFGRNAKIAVPRRK